MRRKPVNPKERIRQLHMSINEINKELDNVLQTGIPQKYWRLKKEKETKKTKLKWMHVWYG